MILNRKNSVFGVVQRTEENKDYTGVKTETAEVSVDNVKREIKVDVDFGSMLGETNQTAYPGLQGKINRELIVKTDQELKDEEARAKQAEDALHKRINDVSLNSTIADAKIEKTLNRIDKTYASKDYVNTQIFEFNKLHKEIVDAVSVEDSTVIVDGKTKPAQDNIIYLVKNIDADGESYNQYLVIDTQLTFVGSTKIDLSDYATITYVDTKIDNIDLSPYATTEFVKESIDAIPEVDLTGYAKLSDIPDVSEFINEIPPEYITETELEDKQYLTAETAESDFATKVYVQTELAKIGTFSKQIVDSVDLTNNKVVVEGQSKDPENNIIYLVKQDDSEVYDQYTLVNSVLTFIGSTDIDLKGYATVDYVDDAVANTYSDVEKLLMNIEFIDGGNAPL